MKYKRFVWKITVGRYIVCFRSKGFTLSNGKGLNVGRLYIGRKDKGGMI